ncbi:MAG TPA: electron transfer flavoprotein subunit alpha/FixB family protein [Chthonomonadaceae bacterium]|nr:electron transfer flavoprotein subunit alpha/FixB family protein [Chthonomonadaceae bacterium]
MTAVLCYAEHQNGRLTDAALEILGAGRALADRARSQLAAALFGTETRPLIETLGEHGADRVLLCEEARLDGYAPEAAVHALADIARQETPRAVLFADTSHSADLAVRLAARLRAAFAPRCTSLAFDPEGRLKVTRTAYADKLQATVLCEQPAPIVTLQPGTGEIKPARRTPRVEERPLTLPQEAARLKLLQTLKADPRTVPLAQAEFIVSGGNGVRDFALLWELADRLGASVGGSRVVCDDGRLPRERQIGESGTTVRPRCYLAFGISGASQHLRGMQDSKLIIAINTDRHAPLMKLANMAVIADAEAVLRALLDQLD